MRKAGQGESPQHSVLESNTYVYHSHTLIPPRGYSIAGISGTFGQWIDGFSLIITR